MNVSSFKAKAFLACLLAAVTATAQEPGRVLGEAASSPGAEGQFALRDGQGLVWGIQLTSDSRIQLVEPGARDLSAAVEVPVASIRPGDRLLVRGSMDRGSRTMLASSVILMSKDAIEAARAREQAEWRTRSLAGSLVSVDSAAQTLVLRVAQSPEPRDWTITVPPGALALRYAEDSIRFADARPAQLTEAAPGDQMRVLGERNPDAGTVIAAKILFGSFRTLGGEITRIDAEASLITIRDVQSRKPVTLRINGGANLRRMPGPAAGGGRPGMGQGMGMGMMRAGGAAGRPDLQQMLDRLPAIEFTALQPGDAIIVAAGRTAGPQPWSVVSLVSGVDNLLRAPAAQVNQTLGNWSMELPMQ